MDTGNQKWPLEQLESGGYSTRAALLEDSVQMSQGETQRQDPVTYNTSIKVLNCANKEFNVYRLRDITNNHFATPISLREEIFRQLGDAVVSRRLDF